jgi:hypothetical protein
MRHSILTISSPDLPGPQPESGRRGRLIFDSFRQPSTSGLRAVLNNARHLVYKCDGALIDLMIGPLPKVGRVELFGQVLGDSVGKIQSANLPVVLVNSSGPVAYAGTNQFGEFHMEIDPEDDLAVRIRVGPNYWIETPLRDMAWARKRLSGASA